MVQHDNALQHLMDLLAIEGPSGKETKVVKCISSKLLAAGCDPSWITTDQAHEKLGEGYETGNLIIQLPGTIQAPRIMFSAHMDTVPLCKGAIPKIEGDRIVSGGETGLGADDRTGCAAMVALAETLLCEKPEHPPITFLFVIAEEGGLFGSRHVDFEELGHPIMGFNLDGQYPNEIVIGAMGAMRWEANIVGKSSHAGLYPQKGISAGLIASRTIHTIAKRGYFGKIDLPEGKGTSNVGTFYGGEATNQVMDTLTLTGECRSHDPDFLEQIVQVYRETFDLEAQSVTNDAGVCGHVNFQTFSDYRAFRIDEQEPCVQRACAAVKSVGLEPNPLIMDAGLDANNFNEKGFPVVTLGAGAHHFHTIDEYVEISEYLTACQVLLHIATADSMLK